MCAQNESMEGQAKEDGEIREAGGKSALKSKSKRITLKCPVLTR